MRLDKFLKVSRIIKRRTVAKEACDAGVILVNGQKAKASKEVRPGDVVEIDAPTFYLKFEILEVPEKPVKKDEARNLVRILEERRKEWEI